MRIAYVLLLVPRSERKGFHSTAVECAFLIFLQGEAGGEFFNKAQLNQGVPNFAQQLYHLTITGYLEDQSMYDDRLINPSNKHYRHQCLYRGSRRRKIETTTCRKTICCENKRCISTVYLFRSVLNDANIDTSNSISHQNITTLYFCHIFKTRDFAVIRRACKLFFVLFCTFFGIFSAPH